MAKKVIATLQKTGKDLVKLITCPRSKKTNAYTNGPIRAANFSPLNQHFLSKTDTLWPSVIKKWIFFYFFDTNDDDDDGDDLQYFISNF